jgi:multiple sugar transport system substrate-binding protein
MTSEEIQKKVTLTVFYLPSLNALYSDRDVLETVPVIRTAKEALQNAKPRPVSPYYSQMSRLMAEQFNQVLTGATSPDEAVETLQNELRQINEQGE